uniref:Uncharacterized protein n=1 Tax=Arundo donax TaxID=35708 RepID=A0A0A9BHW9_ARUDO
MIQSGLRLTSSLISTQQGLFFFVLKVNVTTTHRLS